MSPGEASPAPLTAEAIEAGNRAGAAIDLFLELRDVHGYDEERARSRVVRDVTAGVFDES